MDGLALKSGIGFFKRLLGGSDEQHAEYLQTADGARMLVVDDSPTICAVLGKMLGQDGYAVTKAVDGESAIELARSELPALIFLDIVLPGINGFAVLRALRHDELTRHIPIVMISGNPQATEQFYVQRYGADDFIKKPFGRSEVATCIDVLVRSGRLVARDAARERVLPASMLRDAKPGSIPSLAA
jgi:twitching motility two-component system response regulator PilH